MFNYFLMVPVMFAFSLLSLFGSQIPADEKLMHKIMDQTTKELKQKYRLSCCGSGCGSADDNKIRMCSLSFQMLNSMSMDECREAIMECADRFLMNINNDPKFREYLSVYPFTYNNIDVTIYMMHPDRSTIYHPDIAIVGIEKNIEIMYLTNDPENSYQFKSRIYEPIEEAVKKLQSQHSGR